MAAAIERNLTWCIWLRRHRKWLPEVTTWVKVIRISVLPVYSHSSSNYFSWTYGHEFLFWSEGSESKEFANSVKVSRQTDKFNSTVSLSRWKCQNDTFPLVLIKLEIWNLRAFKLFNLFDTELHHPPLHLPSDCLWGPSADNLISQLPDPDRGGSRLVFHESTCIFKCKFHVCFHLCCHTNSYFYNNIDFSITVITEKYQTNADPVESIEL